MSSLTEQRTNLSIHPFIIINLNFMTSLKTITLALASISIAQSVIAAPSVNHTTISSTSVGSAIMQLHAATMMGDNNIRQYSDIWSRMRSGFEMVEVNPEIVRQHERYFASKSSYVNRTIERSSPYMYYILSEVEKRGMPAEIALLPFIESAYVTKAKSPVGASGLWQFMPATGRQYGLEQNAMYDGRHDITAATNAALNYLQYLYGLFGDWSLALAAYNWGEGNVGKAVARAQAQGLSPVYENLRMPNETRNYVPKLLAIRNLVANPNSYSVNIAHIDNKPYFEIVEIDIPMDIQAASHLAGITESEFIRLNPGFNLPVFMPTSNRKMVLPRESVKTFMSNYKNANKDTLLSWNIYTPISKENISNIASNFGMTTAELRSLNLLRSPTLNPGQSILVSKNTQLPNISINDSLADYNLLESDPLLTTIALQSDKKQQPNIAKNQINLASSTRTDVVKITERAPAPEKNIPQAAQPIKNTLVADNAINNQPDPLLNLLQQNTTPATVIAVANNEAVLPTGSDRSEHIQQSIKQAIAKANAEEARQERIQQAQATKALENKFNGKHLVGQGDTLTNIAKRYNMSIADLTAANQINGDTIQLGQTLKVAEVKKAVAPAQNRETNYVVRKGDTLSSIAGRHNVKVNDIQKWNKSFNPDNLRPGQKIKLYGI